jgi:uncharacterized protein (TIGR03437 family)
VSFNGISASVTAWSTNSINAQVPANATAGNVVVTVNGAASNGMDYTLVGPYSFSVFSWSRLNWDRCWPERLPAAAWS